MNHRTCLEPIPTRFRPAASARVRLTPLLLALIWSGLFTAVSAQKPSAEEHGQQLAAELRQLRPVEGSAMMRLRNSRGKWFREVPVQLSFVQGEDFWQTLYQTFDDDGLPRETLVVTHSRIRPNTYLYVRHREEGKSRMLHGPEANTAFAGSNFWLSDLGMEFFHWPKQRVLRHRMRKGRSCWELESVNPEPASGGYVRVISWIDVEHHAILRAEGYDRNQKVLKEFSVGSVKRVDGKWRLKSMEIRDEKDDARTRLEFDFRVE